MILNPINRGYVFRLTGGLGEHGTGILIYTYDLIFWRC
jgi:hypothetical protein